MLIRKWKITDEVGKEIKFIVLPAPPDLITMEKWEIDMELKTQKILNDLIASVGEFMGGNTIHKIEVEEEDVP